MVLSEIDKETRKIMQEKLAKLGATERLRKNVGNKQYAVARAIQALGDLAQYDCWGDGEKELKTIREGYALLLPSVKEEMEREAQEKQEKAGEKELDKIRAKRQKEYENEIIEEFETRCKERGEKINFTLNITPNRKVIIEKVLAYLDKGMASYFHEEFVSFKEWIEEEGFMDPDYKTPIEEKPAMEMSKSEVWTDLTYILENGGHYEGRMRVYYMRNGTVKQLMERLLKLANEELCV